MASALSPGIPSFRRREMWLALSGWYNNHQANQLKYERDAQHVFGDSLPSSLYTFPLFGAESLRFSEFALKHSALIMFQRLLCVVAATNANVDYCPMLVDIGM